LCDRADPDRIVWGTDYGFGFADSIGYRLGLIRSARIAEPVREKVLGANALRLLRQ
jgi:predicted TIM-barrel fold metal-dependent hydrolase